MVAAKRGEDPVSGLKTPGIREVNFELDDNESRDDANRIMAIPAGVCRRASAERVQESRADHERGCNKTSGSSL